MFLLLVIYEVAVHSSGVLLQMQVVCTAQKLVAEGNTGFVDCTITTNQQGLDKDMDISALSTLKPSQPQSWVTYGLADEDKTTPASHTAEEQIVESSCGFPLFSTHRPQRLSLTSPANSSTKARVAVCLSVAAHGR